MAGQTPSRRQLVQALACASLASGAPGFVRWGFAFAPPDANAAQHTHHAHTTTASPARATLYKPRFFTAPEYATIEVLAELILPRTGTPVAAGHAPGHTAAQTGHAGAHHAKVSPADAGATDAGVAEFIDFMAAEDVRLQEPFRSGLAWMNGADPSGTFVQLAPPAQSALLTRLAYRKNFRPEDKPGQDFFSLMRRYTVMGFYTTEIGLQQLDYPGLQFYGESPAVPNDGSLARVLSA